MLLAKNNIVVFTVVVSCLLLVGVLSLEKTNTLKNVVPTMRGEVSLGKNIVITTTKSHQPILVKREDFFYGDQMRFSGSVKDIQSEIAKALCKEGDTVVNIGAYFGYDALLMSERAGHTGKIYAFEENRQIYKCLKKTVVLNELEDRIIVKNLAILDKKGICEVEDFLSGYQTEEGIVPPSTKFVAECNTLDNELKENVTKVDLMLIDEPGYEFAILNGAKEIISRSPNIIIISYFERKLSARNIDVKAELDKFVDEGFRIYLTDDNGKMTEPGTSEIAAKDSGVLIITKQLISNQNYSYDQKQEMEQQQQTTEAK